ncbi:fatty acid-binding protein [Elysia marginata]|uniref:Fatty acid-binding protein n=1 Tax=Elysia marginata TaxID=1093978 RepID=A0AAV4GJV5_9GAST|nr:fatty acid-binding protein [Elysia marginata]
MVDKFLDIKFKTESEQGLEEYLVAQKIGFVLRNIAKNLSITKTLTRDGDTYTYSFESTFKNHKMVFKLGEPFIDHGADGRDMKTTFFMEGDALIATQENIKEGDVPCRIERRLRPDGKLEAKFISVPTDTLCVRIFAPVKK